MSITPQTAPVKTLTPKTSPSQILTPQTPSAETMTSQRSPGKDVPSLPQRPATPLPLGFCRLHDPVRILVAHGFP